MHRSESFTDKATELDSLRRTLDAAPVAISVLSIQPHRKGGHVVSMEIDHDSLDSLDALIGHIDAEGWMDCLLPGCMSWAMT